jgi:hypothetical protein
VVAEVVIPNLEEEAAIRVAAASSETPLPNAVVAAEAVVGEAVEEANRRELPKDNPHR